jgi:hypothetical protein
MAVGDRTVGDALLTSNGMERLRGHGASEGNRVMPLA